MSGNKYKILIIEDEENIRNFIKTVLVAHGYQVLCAKKGTEGEMLFESHCPDLVILDLGLPDMDGIQFIKKPGRNHRFQSLYFPRAPMKKIR